MGAASTSTSTRHDGGGGGDRGGGGGGGGGASTSSTMKEYKHSTEEMGIAELMALALRTPEPGEEVPPPPRWLVDWARTSMQGVSVGVVAGAVQHARALPVLSSAPGSVYMRRATGVSAAAMRGGFVVGGFASAWCALKQIFLSRISSGGGGISIANGSRAPSSALDSDFSDARRIDVQEEEGGGGIGAEDGAAAAHPHSGVSTTSAIGAACAAAAASGAIVGAVFGAVLLSGGGGIIRGGTIGCVACGAGTAIEETVKATLATNTDAGMMMTASSSASGEGSNAAKANHPPPVDRAIRDLEARWKL